MPKISELEAFSVLDARTGTIISARPLEGAHKPAYVLAIDFGPEIGVKNSSAQLTARYAREELVGKQILAVVNLPAKRIAGFLSEVLVLGVPDERGDTVLVTPEVPVANGARLY